MNNNNVFITGGSGYIGRHVAARLIQKGKKVIIFDTVLPPVPLRNTALYIKGDVTDASAVQAALGKSQVDCVIHLAAVTAVVSGARKRIEHINTTGTKHVVDAMVHTGCRRLIFSSTAAVYQETPRALSETDRTAPKSAYGISKLRAEEYIHKAASMGGIEGGILRLFNVSGAESPFARQREGRGVFFKLYRVAKGKQKYFCIFGGGYDTVDGTAVRDYVHVSDVIRAIELSMYSSSTKGMQTYNIGSGVPTTVLQAVGAVEARTQSIIPVRYYQKRHEEVGYSVSDTSRARKYLKWNATNSTLTNIVSFMG